MKKNITKLIGSPFPIEVVEQTHFERLPKEELSPQDWLKSAVGEDASTLARQKIMQQAEYFLLMDLYPIADRHETIDEEIIIGLLLHLLKSVPAMKNTFETSYILGAILNRLDCYTEENLDTEQGPSEMLSKDLIILETLINLDLQEVDRRVKEDLNRS